MTHYYFHTPGACDPPHAPESPGKTDSIQQAIRKGDIPQALTLAPDSVPGQLPSRLNHPDLKLVHMGDILTTAPPGKKETLFYPCRDIVANEVYSVNGIEWCSYR